jgi:hypothetical protein
MHIEKHLKLKDIRESRSLHRSATFIVRNHSEIVRGKSRIIINYRRLNDNTVDDAYNISNKQESINRIQGYINDMLIFSKTYKEHIAHLNMFFRKVEQNSLILSKKENENMQRKN